MQRQNKVLQNQINSKKLRKGSRRIRTTSQILTSRELVAQYNADLARRRAKELKVAEIKAKKAAEEKQRLIQRALGTAKFGGSLASHKKSALQDIASALELDESGVKAVLVEHIRDHLLAHPELQDNHRYQDLFTSLARGKKRVAASMDGLHHLEDGQHSVDPEVESPHTPAILMRTPSPSESTYGFPATPSHVRINTSVNSYTHGVHSFVEPGGSQFHHPSTPPNRPHPRPHCIMLVVVTDVGLIFCTRATKGWDPVTFPGPLPNIESYQRVGVVGVRLRKGFYTSRLGACRFLHVDDPAQVTDLPSLCFAIEMCNPELPFEGTPKPFVRSPNLYLKEFEGDGSEIAPDEHRVRGWMARPTAIHGAWKDGVSG
ncbi:hypothetical protein BV25DRAFT_1843021 [Artomyces pyxidatus]|uniref:Uncharacterized protein n=1 Tax=Artomyces pyxidatus TaxID=48021 RepID=A0ACB8SFP7_9AGAM|nr:hypothetical protein BV25DRAFT_1843021 [Artomyces pyxidatus]